MMPRALIWTVAAALMGFALGGSVFLGGVGPNVTDEALKNAAAHLSDASPRASKEDNDEALARYTFWLAILTGGLVLVSGVQGYFLLRADKTARTTADAAQAQTQNFTKLERPYLYVFNPDGLELEANREDPYYYVKYQVANYGKTPATIEAVSAGISVGKLPGQLGDVGRWHTLVRTPIMVPNEKRTDLEVAVPEFVPIGEYADEDIPGTPVPDVSGEDEFFVRILIKYRGPFTDGHETSVCWKWANLGLVSVEDGRFTYMR